MGAGPARPCVTASATAAASHPPPAVWELLTGCVPFAGCQWGAILELVALLGQRPEIPEGAPEDYCVLMESCWTQDPARRPTFEEVREAGWQGSGVALGFGGLRLCACVMN